MTAANPAILKQYAKYREADVAAHQQWEKVDIELRKLVRLAKIGRKTSITIPISESRGVEITNQFKGEIKVFTPAFAKKWKLREIELDAE